MSKRGLTFLLFWIGVILGRAIFVPQSLGQPCSLERPVHGEVTRVRRLTGNSAQYELRTENGCGVLATLPRFPAYGLGSVLALDGEVETVADWEARNAGYARYLTRQGVHGTMRFATVQVLHDTEEGNTLKENLIRHTHAAFREPEGSALSAMMWGETTRLPQAVEDNFRRVGVTHILAISGFNLTLVAGGLWGIALLLPLPSWAVAVIVSALVWGYVGLVGAPISAVRAAWFWTLVLFGLRVKWLVSPLTVMLLTVAVMLTVDPNVVFDVGFQLSLAAVVGIWLAWFVSKPIAHKIPKILRAVLISTIGATLATAPIVAYHFGIVSFTTIVANIFIVPATAAFMYVGFAGLFVHYIFPPLALVLSFGVHVIWQFMAWVTEFLAHVPGLTLTEVSVPLAILPLYYLALLIIAHWWLRVSGRTWREAWAP
jgi:competence protein ComEC